MSGRKKIVILLLAISLMIVPFGASAIAQDNSHPIKNCAELMAADCVIVRPLQFASLVTGTAFFVVSLPFSALGGNVGEAYHMMMVEPARMTFKRPLGVF